MADDNATALELEQDDSLALPVAPEGDTLAPIDSPVAEPTNADEDRFYRIPKDEPDYDTIRTMLEDERVRQITKSALGRTEKAQRDGEVALLRAEVARKDQELLQARWDALPPEVQENYRRTNHPVVAKLAERMPDPREAAQVADFQSEYNSLFQEAQARGVPEQRLRELYSHQGWGRTPLEAIRSVESHLQKEAAYWATQRRAQAQPVGASARPIPTQAAAPAAAPVTPQTNPGLRGPGPDSTPRGSSQTKGKIRTSEINNEDFMNSYVPGSLLKRAHAGEVLLPD